MELFHLKAQDFTTSHWSGGTTTQLFIWPADGDYARREFRLRISSAVVALEESDFTPLPGVQRFITPLEGGFTLTHPGKEPVVMGPMDAPYGFSGGEQTHCVGKARDFNLMLQGVEGDMSLGCGRFPIFPGLNAFYAPEDRVYTCQGQVFAITAGELLVVLAAEAGEIDLGDDVSIACYGAV